MSKIKEKLISSGVRELLKSDDVLRMLESEASDRVLQAGPGYSVNTYVGKTRCNAEILAETAEARQDALENNTLLRLVSS